MGKSLAERKEEGERAELRVESYLRSAGIPYLRTGVDSLYGKAVYKTLSRLAGEYPELLAIVHVPDFSAVVHGSAIWIDVKSSALVAETSYRHYLRLADTRKVYLFFALEGEPIRSVSVDRIAFETCGGGTIWRPPTRAGADNYAIADLTSATIVNPPAAGGRYSGACLVNPPRKVLGKDANRPER
jgi:hypothetical protein